MSSAQQDFGFNRADPVIVGKTAQVQFTIANLTAAEVASAEWALFTLRPEEEPSQTALVTKTVGSGITLTDNAGSLDVLVSLDPDDTSTLPGGDYFHRLDYVHTNGDQFEAARGTGRLTPRV
ncbi:MAG: hypothetical protein ACR2QF_15565 [Geminicoccaceae bacterium]